MAEHLALMFGTEKDKVNCPFYYKIGACRHGDRCTRMHNRPLFSPTLRFENMYLSPERLDELAAAAGKEPVAKWSSREKQQHFDDFYEDVYEELAKFGDIDEMRVCGNLSGHLAGSVYVKFFEDEAAQQALASVHERFYEGRPIKVEFSPVTDFVYARCRPFERDLCDRGDYCNFMHVQRVGDELYRRLQERRRGLTGAGVGRSPRESPRSRREDSRDRRDWDEREYGTRHGGPRDLDRRERHYGRDRDIGSRAQFSRDRKAAYSWQGDLHRKRGQESPVRRQSDQWGERYRKRYRE